MFNKTIGGKVMKTLNAHIEAKEKEHEDGCKAIDERAENEKVTLAERLANEILAKII